MTMTGQAPLTDDTAEPAHARGRVLVIADEAPIRWVEKPFDAKRLQALVHPYVREAKGHHE